MRTISQFHKNNCRNDPKYTYHTVIHISFPKNRITKKLYNSFSFIVGFSA